MIPPSEKMVIASAAMMAQFRMPDIERYMCEFELSVVLPPGMNLCCIIQCLYSTVISHSIEARKKPSPQSRTTGVI